MDGWVWGSWRYGWNAFSWRAGWHMQVTSEVGRIYKSSQHTHTETDIQHFQLQVFVITTMLGSIGLGRVARLGMIEILNNADNAGASFLKLPLPPDRVWKNLDLCWSRCPLCLTRLQMCQMNIDERTLEKDGKGTFCKLLTAAQLPEFRRAILTYGIVVFPFWDNFSDVCFPSSLLLRFSASLNLCLSMLFLLLKPKYTALNHPRKLKQP